MGNNLSSIFASDASQAVFALDASSLRLSFANVTTADDFTAKVLPETRVPSQTALYCALQSFFGENPCALSAFVKSLVDSAAQVLVEVSLNKHIFTPEPARCEFTRSFCRGVLANAMLGNMGQDVMAKNKPRYQTGGLHHTEMFGSTSRAAVEKVKCFVQYFVTTQNPCDSMDEVVTFYRISGLSAKQFISLNAWDDVRIGSYKNSNKEYEDAVKEITIEEMETREAGAIVDFGNAVYGGGFMTESSCTQEEILQLCCPEFNVGMLVFGTMPDDAVIVVANARRYSDYSGYRHSFRFQGPIVGGPYSQTIVDIDASEIRSHDQLQNQFRPDGILRDMRKAYLGFLVLPLLLHPLCQTWTRAFWNAPNGRIWMTMQLWLLHPCSFQLDSGGVVLLVATLSSSFFSKSLPLISANAHLCRQQCYPLLSSCASPPTETTT
jgi:Poly (ADP-ribose) glycohydrolase (PARG)